MRECGADPDDPPLVAQADAIAAKYDRQNTRAQTVSAINTAIRLSTGREPGITDAPDIKVLLRRKTMAPRSETEAARRITSGKKSLAWYIQPVLQKMDVRVA